jgi:DNA polymerase-3 subunit alpha
MDSDQYGLYLRRKKGTEEVTFAHADLKELLQDNYGICIFQEDLMQMAVILAGYTSVEAYGLMKGVGKKKMEIVREHITMFMDRAKKVGKVDDAGIQQVVQQLEAAGRYAFNRSHAVEYAHITYACGHLSAYHPAEFFGKQISYADDESERAKYLSAAIARGIEILHPSIDKSEKHLTVEDGKLRLGLLTMKGVGDITAQEIIANRPYDSIDKVLKVVNRSVYSALHAAGAVTHVPGVEHRPPVMKLDEAEVLGISLGGLMREYQDVMDIIKPVKNEDVGAEAASMLVKVAGIKPWKDKHKRSMAFLTLIDVFGPKIDSVMFWEAFKNYPPEKGGVYHAVVSRSGTGSIMVNQLVSAETIRELHAVRPNTP